MTRLPGGPTQDEIVAVSLQKLGLVTSDIFADIGCGTGKVAVSAAPRVRQVYAADIREEAVSCTLEQVRNEGLTNVEVTCEHGAELIRRLPRVDAAFIGGSKDLPTVLSLLAEKKVRSVVVNAVLLSTLNEAVSSMQALSLFREVVQVSVSRSSPLAGDFMLRPIDPVFIVSGGCGC